MPIVHFIPIEANKLKLKSIYINYVFIMNRFIENTCVCDTK